MSEELVQCYNKGCQQKYNPKENGPESCKYHPGYPIFHDGRQGWSCCKKRCVDFQDFLNTPGCARGLHSNVKPVEVEKSQNGTEEDTTTSSTTTTEIIVKPPQPMKRPSADEPMVRLPSTVADSLRVALEKSMLELSVDDGRPAQQAEGEVAKGTSCKNKSCTAVYEGEHSNNEVCSYHSGAPVFHEGMKFWSCCERKTTDFNAFLSQVGCCTGKHVWVAKDDDGEKKVACRHDWHQTGSFVTVSVFTKLTQPLKTWVEVNKVTLKVNIVFDGGKSQFEKSFVLSGIIDPEKSSVKMLGTKVEINLKKMEPGSWPALEPKSKN